MYIYVYIVYIYNIYLKFYIIIEHIYKLWFSNSLDIIKKSIKNLKNDLNF